MPAKKRLIVCCDGTWNDADSGDNFTNVVRIARATLPYDNRGGQMVPQIVYYHSGVGTGGDLIHRLAGGGIGLGLSRNVRDAYSFLADNYCDGDEIFLFGFSRGAYTVRSLGGLIGCAGILRKRDMDSFVQVWEAYRLKTTSTVLPNFPERHTPVPIRCIGVWDTVGALGIPGNMDQIFTSFYQFHDTELGTHVENAFQALALDERRPDFEPAVWTQNPAATEAGRQMLRQVWFAGAHCNVGGGYPQHGLSDVALAWIASQVEPMLAIDRTYLQDKQDRRALWGLGKIYDSSAGVWQLRGTESRRPFAKAKQGTTTNEKIHPSVAERRQPDVPCDPSPYDGNALTGITIDKHLADLADLEAALKWTRVEAPPPEPPPASFLNRVLKDFGIG